MASALSIGMGIALVLLITAATAYFVAQEFGYMAVDRSALHARSEAGDTAAKRALGITRRTSFMLSGAQLGITVTGLVVGYIAEPAIGSGVADLLGFTELPRAVLGAIGAVLALIVATVVQMVFGELVPKNYAIARSQQTAKRLALSTTIYLAIFGWLIRVFDAASNALLRAVRITPVHDVEQAANSRDLESIIDESRESGDLPHDLSVLLDRSLGFAEVTARMAMTPRLRVDTVSATQPLSDLIPKMAQGHSRYPVVREDVDDIIGVVYLRDALTLNDTDRSTQQARDISRLPVLVPETLPLPDVLAQLREVDEEFACVMDEYGGFAGVISIEDIAEELVGEIADEHDPVSTDPDPVEDPDAQEWDVLGSIHIDEAERLVGFDFPRGHYTTLGGLVMAQLGQLPASGDVVTITVTSPLDGQEQRQLAIRVCSIDRRVPHNVEMRWAAPPQADDSSEVAS